MSASRREFFRQVLGMAAVLTGSRVTGSPATAFAAPVDATPDRSITDPIATPNVLMVVTDEERHWNTLENLIASERLGAETDPAPGTFRSLIPARMRLRRNGVRFNNYYTPTAPCSPARSTLYTGHHAPDTQVVDNMDFECQDSMRAEIPTIADVLGQAGYYCAYKGKVHLAKDSDLTTAVEMEARYGFKDWQGPYRATDSEGPQAGATRDDEIAQYAVTWLQTTARATNQEGQPWFLAVNFINPHDIMLADIDGAGTVQTKQGDGPNSFPVVPPPPRKPYFYWWNPQKPANFVGQNGYAATDSGPRPQALEEFASLLSVFCGNIPGDDSSQAAVRVYLDNAHPELGTETIHVPMWQAYLNTYLNCIIDNDRSVQQVLDTLAEDGLEQRTIVLLTADHGEMAMSHMGFSRYYDEAALEGYQDPDDTGTMMPLRQKGPLIYEENHNLPFVVANLATTADALVHRYVPTRNVDVPVLAAAVDVLPTLLSWTGKRALWYRRNFGSTLGDLQMKTRLPGVSLDRVIRNPRRFRHARWHDGRNGRNWVLFTSDAVVPLDADFAYLASWNRCAGKTVDTTRRGILRGIYDGEHKYARYFSPLEYELNERQYAGLDYVALTGAGRYGQDLQLFIHSADPHETFNAAEVEGQLVRDLNLVLYTAMRCELFSVTRIPEAVQRVIHGEVHPCS